MTLLSLREVCKRHGTTPLLDKIDLSINKGERLALIGQNGSGKSTLLNIIQGALPPDSGQRILKRELKILSLPQEVRFCKNHTVEQSIEASLEHLKKAQMRLEELANHHEIASNEGLKEEYANLQAYLDLQNGWDIESKIKNLMKNFGLDRYKGRLSTSLSGGEQRRVALACMLLEPADLLLLDEPTNHLDNNMTDFLEQNLSNGGKTIIFVSHDRYFIDSVATRIVELDLARLRSFTPSTQKGTYLSYLEAKQNLLSNLQKEQEELKKILKHEEEWLQRGVQARRKRNEGRKERLFALREKLKGMPTALRNISKTLESGLANTPNQAHKNQQKLLFNIQNLSLKLDGKPLIKGLNILISQGERLGLVGRNGSGKTSLLKLLKGDYQIDSKESKGLSFSGRLDKAQSKIGYFDQHKSVLKDDKNLLETFCPKGGDSIDLGGKSVHVYGYLKNFLFPKDSLTKRIGQLSGGEKARVALALLLSKPYDCLLLDEPTSF